MKKIIPVIIAACLLLAGCGVLAPATSAAPTPSAGPPFVFTRDNFPAMDGSTSMAPLAEAAACVLLGESRESAAELVSFNRTSQSFRNLAAGQCDILIAAEPAESVWDELDSLGFKCDLAHICTDALVFVVNADNPVDSLTAEQLRGIYSGRITNWSEVGGDDIEIIPFQRNPEAGSQAAMLRLVMGGVKMTEPPKQYIIESMSGLMEAVRSFDGSDGAIGYSVYYYAEQMRMAEGLKLIAVDGVEPSDDTIRSGDYPFLANSYAVVSSAAAEDSAERIMWEWLQGVEGQKLIAECGYVSVR